MSALLLAAGLTVAAETVVPIAASAVQAPASCQGQGSVTLTNGSFEIPRIPTRTFRLLAESAVPGWSTDDSRNQIEFWVNGFGNVTAADGRQFIELNANNASMLYQDVATKPGQTLVWSLKHRGRHGTDVMRVMIGAPAGSLVQNGPNLADGNAAWGSRTGSYIVPEGQTMTRFGFEAVSTVGGNAQGNLLDDITIGTGPCLVSTKSVQNLAGVSTTATVGDTLRYTVTTTNDGANPALQSVSTDILPAGADFVPGSIKIISGAGAGALTDADGDDRGEYTAGTRTIRVRLGNNGTVTEGGSVDAGAVTSYTFDVKVRPDAANTTIVNEAHVVFREPATNLDHTSISNETQTPVNPAADIIVEQTASTPSIPLQGEVNFVITARNDGPSTGAGVVVNEAVSAGLIITGATPSVGTWSAAESRWAVGTLLPGEAATLTVTARAVATGTLTNTTTVTSQTPDPDPSNNTDSSTVEAAASSDLSIIKTATANPAMLNGPMTYTIVVTNTGPSAAAAVSVSDPLSVALLNPTTPTAGCAITAGQLDCAVGILAVGATFTATVSGTVDPATATTAISNTATVMSTTPDPDPSDNSSTNTIPVSGTPRIELVKAASTPVDANGTDRLDAGDTVAYTFTVRNTGNVTFTSVMITDPMLGGPVTCTALAAQLAPGTEVTCAPVTYTLTQQNIDAGAVHNEASVTGESPQGSATDDTEANVTVSAVSSVVLTKSPSTIIAANGTSEVNSGDTISYTFTVTNTGATTLTNAEITDPMLGGAGTCSALDGATLLPGQSITCDPVEYILTQEDIDNGMVRNTASVIADSPTGEVGDTASASADISRTAVIELQKTAGQVQDLNGDGFIGAGDTAEYSFTVRNTGNTTLTGVTVSDPLWDAGALCTIGTLPAGGVASCGAFIYTLTQADIEAEQRPNTATAGGTSPLGPVTDDSPAGITFIGTPAIELTKVPGAIDPGDDGMIGAGDTVPYTFTSRNTGTVILTDVLLDDPLLGGAVDCPALDKIELAPGDEITCGPATYELTQADIDGITVHNIATVEGDSIAGPAKDTSEGDVIVNGTDRLSLLKSVAAIIDANGNGRTDAGDTIADTFTVTNTGTTTLRGVTVNDPRLGSSVVCDTTTLAPGEQTVCNGPPAVLSQAEIDAGEIVTTATATATGTGDDPPTAEDTVTTPIERQPAIGLTKTGGEYVDADENGKLNAGDTVEFRFTMINAGAVTLTDIAIDDPKLGGAVSCNTPDLVPGETANCGPFRYVLTGADIEAGKVINVATATGGSGGVIVTAAATATVNLNELAETGSRITGLSWALVLLTIGALVLLLTRVRRREAET